MNSVDRHAPTLLIETAQPDSVPDVLTLDADASRHVTALRLRQGDRVRITNGRGDMWTGRLEPHGGRNGARVCRLDGVLAVDPLLPVVLAFGIGAKPRTLWLVEKAVELGVGVLQPVEVTRSASVADAGRSPSFWDKARRRAAAALEQCGGAWLPELRDPVSAAAWLAEGEPEQAEDSARRVVLTPDARIELTTLVRDWDGRSALTLFVGPEGGLEPAEIQAALRHGFLPARIGPRTLRFETAAIAASAILGQQAAERWRTAQSRKGALDE